MKTIKSLLQFTTVLPLGKPQDLEPFARRSYIYPLAGYVIGVFVALPVYFIANPTIAAAVAVALLLLITGAHHFDGLLDLGDGLMAHGDQEKRIRALTDRNVGAGAIALGIAVTLLLFAGLQEATSIACALIIGEVCAKFSMAFLTVYGKPFHEGMHSYLHQFAQPVFPAVSFLLCLPLFLLPIAPVKIITAMLLMLLCPIVLLGISQRIFGGINGDVAGASNEITRALVIVSIALI
ncbi:adenosylcobinamide-GDP ribazoletransferase [Methanoregula sp.]|uniref:adenosylcobinamide-GDP ribazoletransferase n=1 Tax=Methanoregula sp. TaxID=2052170 RepID=UPI0023729E16|nr:adenosylcobinamide-GDP ribazoletransferase [Methanoregula sp.]MDD1685669.1 adenosylcobinamide-GDP ribazoletransferase [Methanoregula sp.]